MGQSHQNKINSWSDTRLELIGKLLFEINIRYLMNGIAEKSSDKTICKVALPFTAFQRNSHLNTNQICISFASLWATLTNIRLTMFVNKKHTHSRTQTEKAFVLFSLRVMETRNFRESTSVIVKCAKYLDAWVQHHVLRFWFVEFHLTCLPIEFIKTIIKPADKER